MKSWQRLLLFLVLNVLVSACATFSVLYIWDRSSGQHLISLADLMPRPATATAPAALASPTPEPTPTRTFLTYQVQSGDTFESIAARFGVDVNELVRVNGFTMSQQLGVGEVLRIPVGANPADVVGVRIESVLAVNDLDSERVVLQRTGEGDLEVAGWRLEDEDGNAYTFPDLILNRGGAIELYSRTGTDTVVELFWGLERPVWQSGELVTLRDREGAIVATYAIP
jgi:LysM repeat protein